MSHLTAAEFVDLLEGRLGPERARHADSCGACQAQIDGLRDALLRSADLRVPEPSPLFWEQFASRVQHRIFSSDDLEDRRVRRPALLWLGAAAATVLIALSWMRFSTVPGDSTHAPSLVRGVDAVADFDDWEKEEAWAVIRAAAEQISAEEVDDAGLSAQPGAVDSAMNRLTEKERERLITLIEEELKRSGA